MQLYSIQPDSQLVDYNLCEGGDADVPVSGGQQDAFLRELVTLGSGSGSVEVSE